MKKVLFCWENAKPFLSEQEIRSYSETVKQYHNSLHNGTGKGNDFLGWLDVPNTNNAQELALIKETVEQVQSNCEALIVIGIGGSYLGTRAVLEILQHSFYNLISKEKRTTPQIFFLGQHISSTYLMELFDVLEGKDVCVNVISKSGTTTEPAIAFRVIKDWMENKYGKEEASKRIIATTDQSKGALRTLANEEGYTTFVIPDDIGGRYSVLTPVGLFPLAVAGIDIKELLCGAEEAKTDFSKPELFDNDAYVYAVIRNILYKQGKGIELLAYYEPSANYLAEWWKQLFGESEGKDGKGIFPASVGFTTDLHSLGQYVQDGQRHFFETVLTVDESRQSYVMKEAEHDMDGLNYLAGKTMDYVNQKAYEGTTIAHLDGQVPNLRIRVPKLTEFHVGYLLFFFMKSCAISGYLLGVNPFDQPGVEEYKKNMFALLGKEGFEERRDLLLKRK